MFACKRIVSFVLSLLFGVVLAACGSAASREEIATPVPSPSATTESSAPGVQVEIKLFNFQQKEITVPVGTRVTWTNQDDIQHSVTSGTPADPDGLFDSDFFNQHETFSMIFDTPGTYNYFCRRHEHMQGVVIVTAP